MPLSLRPPRKERRESHWRLAPRRFAAFTEMWTTNAWLDRLCGAGRIALSPTSPGPDGFVIEVVEDSGRQVVLIGGCNERGVVYGQDAFFDLLRREGNAVAFAIVSVRDWPSIAWRGRPHSVLQQHLAPGAMDAYVRSRLNFTDVRDNPRYKGSPIMPPRKASMGFPPGAPIDKPLVKRVIDEAHRRAMFVYGTVSCAVKEGGVDAVLGTFRELIALGVDGLWLSFDDTGAGQAAPTVIRRVLELGRQHGMTDRRIAVTPPLHAYQHIDKEFNRASAAIPGFADATWLFTRVPCVADAAMAREIGLKRLPGWWHNLVSFRGGFLHNGGIAVPLRADGRPGYLNIQPLSMGWHRPTYDRLRNAAENTDTILLWGLVGGWPEEYQLGALGIWAWEPAKHDWARTRQAIYRCVFGHTQADAARKFDDRLAALKDLFHLPPWRYLPNKGWPCRLRQLDDRPEALALIDELEELLKTLEAKAPTDTAIEPSRLANVYLEPMRATLAAARTMARLDYPEYAMDDLDAEMFELLEAGKEQEAAKKLDAMRARVEQQVSRVAKELDGLKGIAEYAAYWRKRLSGLGHWKQLAIARRKKAREQFAKTMTFDPAMVFPNKKPRGGDVKALFAALRTPPAGFVLAEAGTKDWLANRPRWRGAWGVGRYETDGQPLVAIAYPPGAPSKPGDYGEVCVELPVPKHQSGLALDVFVNDTRLDNKWRNYRFMQLYVNDTLVWEEDIAPDREGREWVTVDVTEAAKASEKLRLRFRVTDKRGVSTHSTVTFLGPVRLREKGQTK